MTTAFVSFLVALAVSLLLTPAMRWVALRLKLVHYPRRQISIDTHVDPIPYLGGAAIFVAFAACSLAFASRDFPVAPVLLAATVLVLTGLIDDNKVLSVPGKLIGQIGAAIIILATDSGLMRIPHVFGRDIVNYTITFFWIVGIINAVNFLDIMDGLAGGVATIAALAFAGAALVLQEVPVAAMAAALAGGALGFLAFNFTPARIFMGDAGSQFLGFMLAVLPLILLREQRMLNNGNERIILASMMILGIPIFEMVFTVAARTFSGKLPWKGSKDHFALRAFAMGHPIQGIVLSTYAAGAILALLGLAQLFVGAIWMFLVLSTVVFLAVLVSVWFSRVIVPKPNND